MVRRGKKKLVLLGAGVLGLAVATLALFAVREPVLNVWFSFKLERAAPEDRWELARSYEEAGPAARRAAKDWYQGVLRSWEPDPVAVTFRDSSAVTFSPAPPSDGPSSQPELFHYPDEADAARAAARLGAMRSLEAIDELVAQLERSNPEFPLLSVARARGRSGRLRGGGSGPRFRCLHASGRALFEIGAEAIDSLIEATRSDKPNARIQAALTLAALVEAGVAGDRAVDAILAGYCGADETLRSIARGLITELTTRPALLDDSVIATVVECIRGDPVLALGSSSDLARLGARGGAAGPALVAALRDRSLPESTRMALLSALRRSAPLASVVEPALRELLNDESRQVRLQATHAIRTVGCGSPETIDALACALADDADRDVRHGAVQALGNLGVSAKAALPVVRATEREDPVPMIRKLARDALKKIEGR